jgi:DNA-binding response OmpR family regulator
MRLLVVEDSERLRRWMSRGLRDAGFSVDAAADGDEGLHLATSNEYDVLVLDLMLPGIDGLTLLRKLREGGSGVHVLILTAKDTVEDRVTGLNHGADDYLVKPFAFAELIARIQALVRRQYGVKDPRLVIAGLEIDTAQRLVRRGDKPIALRPREYALLEFLALRRGELVSRNEIEQHIYDERVQPMSNVVDTAICALRRRVDMPGERSLIETRRGMGYIFDPGAP